MSMFKSVEDVKFVTNAVLERIKEEEEEAEKFTNSAAYSKGVATKVRMVKNRRNEEDAAYKVYASLSEVLC